MGMQVSEVITHAVNEYFDNPGTATDDITPSMAISWCYWGVMEMWRKLKDQEFGYFQIRQNTLSITSGTSVYAIPNASTTTNTTSSSVAAITKVFVRQGAADPFTYIPVPPLYPTERYWAKMSNILFPMSNISASSPGFFWSSNTGALDGSGNPTLNIEFSPTPSFTGTIVYDGIRYPAKPAATTDFIDLPDHLHRGVILWVLKQCYLRDKADLTEINKEIEDFYHDALNFEAPGLQADGPLIVKENR